MAFMSEIGIQELQKVKQLKYKSYHCLNIKTKQKKYIHLHQLHKTLYTSNTKCLFLNLANCFLQLEEYASR